MPKLTVLDKIVTAIRALRDAKGTSRVALQKYLKAELECGNATATRQALKKGVKDGVLVQVTQTSTVENHPLSQARVFSRRANARPAASIFLC